MTKKQQAANRGGTGEFIGFSPAAIANVGGDHERKGPTMKTTVQLPVTVKTYPFEFAHGRKPRGEGYWAFSFTRDVADVCAPGVLFFVNASYGEAKKAAVAEAKRRGSSTVWVMS